MLLHWVKMVSHFCIIFISLITREVEHFSYIYFPSVFIRQTFIECLLCSKHSFIIKILRGHRPYLQRAHSLEGKMNI